MCRVHSGCGIFEELKGDHWDWSKREMWTGMGIEQVCLKEPCGHSKDFGLHPKVMVSNRRV
jgi:hypothetical protein